MKDKYQETIRTWNKIADLYEDVFMELDLYNDTYDLFCELIDQPSASILEIGCGPGNISRYLKTQHPDYHVLATDAAKQMIELAGKNVPDVVFQTLDCREIHHIRHTFDGIICGFTIPYLSKEECRQLITDCYALLNEKGVFYLSFVAGDYENSGYLRGSTGDRTYFHYHDLEKIKLDIYNSGFRTIDIIEKVYQRKEDVPEGHTIVIAHKR